MIGRERRTGKKTALRRHFPTPLRAEGRLLPAANGDILTRLARALPLNSPGSVIQSHERGRRDSDPASLVPASFPAASAALAVVFRLPAALFLAPLIALFVAALIAFALVAVGVLIVFGHGRTPMIGFEVIPAAVSAMWNGAERD